ncbi:MAG TPA: FKBP-type peptidyl-prolyl cis-trans isomerase [Solirubrobacterales bacterium]|nr:FKBP-type peptidyl-prolyl cis-trans isomerase [Solirubrobacterales bacterium]
MAWRYLGLIAGLCLALALAACGSGSADEGKPTRPEIEAPDEPPKELIVEDLEEGSGRPVQREDKLTIHYEGVGMDGETLYSSWRNGSPLEMTLGKAGFGEGFEEGVEGLKVGGRRELQIPADLAPFETPVVYVVDLLKIEPPRGPKKLVVEDLQKGSGPQAKRGDKLTVNYEGVGYDGKLLYSSSQFRGSPLTFRLGVERYGESFEQGIVGMRAGGRRELQIPADMAPSEIPLIYTVELLELEKRSSAEGAR